MDFPELSALRLLDANSMPGHDLEHVELDCSLSVFSFYAEYDNHSLPVAITIIY